MRNARNKVLSVVVALGCLAGTSSAQFKNGSQPTELNIPRVSQRGTVTQRIGLTDITISYHRPAVGGREIWGKIVPYGKVWRAGANENSTITLADDVSVEGKALAAGTYGLHMIPDKDQWTIIFSKNSTSWGSFSYDEKEDALRVNVKPHADEQFEFLTYTFDDVKPDSAVATMRWEKLAVPFQISVDVKAVVLRSIKNELRNVGGFTWAGYDEAAEWCLDNNYNLEEALKWKIPPFKTKTASKTGRRNRGFSKSWDEKTRRPGRSQRRSIRPRPSSCMSMRETSSGRETPSAPSNCIPWFPRKMRTTG